MDIANSSKVRAMLFQNFCTPPKQLRWDESIIRKGYKHVIATTIDGVSSVGGSSRSSIPMVTVKQW
ncbi:hypothetical protein MHBO_004336 [Bonamia ostreae]|uniref:Uncharacterized protein n=1 Tax=Bonamia ostreae TaxID=126728 RepID=A0ABV2AT44_9EUKA